MNQEKLNQKIFRVLSYIIKKENKPQNTVTFFREIDCSVIENLRSQYKLLGKRKPTYTAFIIKAISQAITEYPFVNAKVFPGFIYSKIFKFPEIHAAAACEKDMPGTEFFAFLDILKNTDKKSIDAIYQELFDLANADIQNNSQLKIFMRVIKNYPVFLARQLCTLPALIPSLWMKYRGAGFIISSPSKYGVDAVAGTWPHPLGFSFGLVQKKAIVRNNKVEAVLCFTLTMNFDRRIMAGAPAAKFFNCIANNLMDQNFLISHLEEKVFVKDTPLEKITSIA